MSFLARLILKMIGWKLDIEVPDEKKFVLIGAPHTSNWDFPLALLAFWTLDLNIKWVGKIQMFRGPLKHLFTALGGIPVDRSAPGDFIKQIAEQFEQRDEMVLTIAPEGTRSKMSYWKSGFYYIALEAEVPICLGFMDYTTKTIGFKQLLYPSGNLDADIKIIADFYHGLTGKYPEKQGPIRIRPNN